MKPILVTIFGAAVMASPMAPAGCETVRVGVSYRGQYADYSVTRAVTGGRGEWDILISAEGKRIVPLHPSR